MTQIAPSATVDPQAEIAEEVEIGPGCYVGPKVRLGRGTRLVANVVILGNTRIGEGNLFYPTAVLGAAPQDLKYQGTDTELVIGDHNIFREAVTIHPGTEMGGGVTRIGSHNQFQVGSHLGHDVKVGEHCILSNSVQVAGHVHIEDHVNISGLVGIQQFVTVGQYSFVTGASRCTTDTPPYLISGGYETTVLGVNVKGLGRWGFDDAAIQELRELYRRLFPPRNASTPQGWRNLYNLFRQRSGENGRSSLARRLQEAESNGSLGEHSRYLVEFLKRSVGSVHGRYLESLRRDDPKYRPAFYGGGNGARS